MQPTRLLFLFTWPMWTTLIVVLLFYFLVQQLAPNVAALKLNDVVFSPTHVPGEVYTGAHSGEAVSLPHNWSREGFAGQHAWYFARLKLNVPPNRLWCIYLPSVAANAAVYVNGRFLGSGGEMSVPPTRNDFRPLYFAIPNGMLIPDENEIAVHVVSDPPGRGFLGPLLLGPDETLGHSFKRSHFIRVTLVQFIAVSLLVSMFYVGVLAIKTRDSVYFYFAALLGAGTLFDASLLLIDLRLPGRYMDWLRMLGTGWLVVFLIFFLHRFLNIYRPLIERIVLIWAVTGTVLLALLPHAWAYSVSSYYWDVMTIVWGGYALVIAWHASFKVQSKEYWAIALSVLVLLGAGVRDWIMYTENPEIFQGTLLIYAMVYPLVIFAWVLLQRFTTALSEADLLNRELEDRVKRREAELAANYEKISAAKQQQALIEERERIMRDMHDGIGGQLIAATAEARQVGSKRLVDSLECALADLRLMIDSFEPVDEDLGTVLGLVRMRLERRLRNHNLHFDWRVEDLPPIKDFGPHKVLQVMRILEEAVTNVVRHAQASRIIVSAREKLREGIAGIGVEIIDDGRGIDPAAPKGSGLENMRYRAQSIGGHLVVEAVQPGTAVRLWLPLVPATAFA